MSVTNLSRLEVNGSVLTVWPVPSATLVLFRGAGTLFAPEKRLTSFSTSSMAVCIADS
jgi:hypothetical protein